MTTWAGSPMAMSSPIDISSSEACLIVWPSARRRMTIAMTTGICEAMQATAVARKTRKTVQMRNGAAGGGGASVAADGMASSGAKSAGTASTGVASSVRLAVGDGEVESFFRGVVGHCWLPLYGQMRAVPALEACWSQGDSPMLTTGAN